MLYGSVAKARKRKDNESAIKSADNRVRIFSTSNYVTTTERVGR